LLKHPDKPETVTLAQPMGWV